MALKDAPTSVLLENVLSLIHQKLPKKSASLVECFVAKFYGNMASTDLHDRNDSDLYGAALSLWNALNQRTSTEPYIRVYNPELTRHGWQSPIPSSKSSCRTLPSWWIPSAWRSSAGASRRT